MVFHHVRLTIALAPLIKRPARYSQHSRHFFHRPRSSILKLFHGRSSKLLAPLLTHFLFLLSRPTFPLLLHATSILTLGVLCRGRIGAVPFSSARRPRTGGVGPSPRIQSSLLRYAASSTAYLRRRRP